jgi:hypothetical protein
MAASAPLYDRSLISSTGAIGVAMKNELGVFGNAVVIPETYTASSDTMGYYPPALAMLDDVLVVGAQYDRARRRP